VSATGPIQGANVAPGNLPSVSEAEKRIASALGLSRSQTWKLMAYGWRGLALTPAEIEGSNRDRAIAACELARAPLGQSMRRVVLSYLWRTYGKTPRRTPTPIPDPDKFHAPAQSTETP
jgi:hypothetical protein